MDWTNDTEHKKFQILNETKLSKKSLKLGAIPKSKTKDRVNLSAYNVIPYVSSKIGISEDELIKEAEAFLKDIIEMALRVVLLSSEIYTELI